MKCGCLPISWCFGLIFFQLSYETKKCYYTLASTYPFVAKPVWKIVIAIKKRTNQFKNPFLPWFIFFFSFQHTSLALSGFWRNRIYIFYFQTKATICDFINSNHKLLGTPSKSSTDQADFKLVRERNLLKPFESIFRRKWTFTVRTGFFETKKSEIIILTQ